MGTRNGSRYGLAVNVSVSAGLTGRLSPTQPSVDVGRDIRDHLLEFLDLSVAEVDRGAENFEERAAAFRVAVHGCFLSKPEEPFDPRFSGHDLRTLP